MKRKYTKRRPDVPAPRDWLMALLNLLSRLMFTKQSPTRRMLAIVAVLALALVMVVAAFLLVLAGMVVAAIFLFPHETTRLTAWTTFFSAVAAAGCVGALLRRRRRDRGAGEGPKDSESAAASDDAPDELG